MSSKSRKLSLNYESCLGSRTNDYVQDLVSGVEGDAAGELPDLLTKRDTVGLRDLMTWTEKNRSVKEFEDLALAILYQSALEK